MLLLSSVWFAMPLQAMRDTSYLAALHKEVNAIQLLPSLPSPTWKWVPDHQVHGRVSYQHFILTCEQIPVQNAMATVAYFKGNALVSAEYPGDFRTEKVPIFSGDKLCWKEDINENGLFLYRMQMANRYTISFEPLGTGQRHWQDMRRNFNGDSAVRIRVFLPDPLSPQNKPYGFPLTDRGDSTYPAIEAAMTEVNLRCRFENDSFRPGNQWLYFQEISDPKTTRGISKGIPTYTRNQPAFEEWNAFYHLQKLQQWWDSLGFADWKDTVLIDVHAMFGQDDSYFNPLAKPHTIEFGDGGVDDAEDADAIVHEYTHAAFEKVIPGGYAGTQRQGLEEGICDFMALCYSRKFTQNQAGWVYNWDGHNEFWDGRNLQNNRTYPASLTNQPHVDGQLFGAALFELAKEIGDDSTLKIVMAAMPMYIPGISMRKAAELLLKTDSLLNGGRTRWPLVKALYPRGLLPGLDLKKSAVPAGYLLRNTQSFAMGGDLEICSFQKISWKICDVSGKTILEKNQMPGETYVFPAAGLSDGVYFFCCGIKSEKLLVAR